MTETGHDLNGNTAKSYIYTDARTGFGLDLTDPLIFHAYWLGRLSGLGACRVWMNEVQYELAVKDLLRQEMASVVDRDAALDATTAQASAAGTDAE